MAATNYSPIQLYYSTTASASPAAGNLVSGELAINITDGILFYKDNAGSVQTLATKAGTSGSYSSITLTGGTANGVAYLNGSKVLTTGSALTFDGTYFNANGLRISGSDAGNTIYKASGNFFLTADAGTLALQANSSNPIAFYLNSSEQMRLTSTGLGIGTSSPARKLDVNGSIQLPTNNALYINGSSNYLYADTSAMELASATQLKLVTNGALRATFDSSGNLGLGVTPSAWSGFKAFDIGANGNISSDGGGLFLPNNAYDSTGSGGWKYKRAASAPATLYLQTSSGEHRFYNAPSGTAGNAISFTQAMTLDASGNLGVGTTSPDAGSGAKLTTKGIYVDTGGGDAGYGWQIVSTSSGAAPLQLIAPSITFATGANLARSTRLTLDSSGNLGLGVTPSASSACVNMELSAYGATLSARNNASAPQFAMMSNAVGNWYAPTYKINGKATMYLSQGNDGSHSWHTAGTGTAGNAITFTQAMTLDASGRLAIGITNAVSGRALTVVNGTNTTVAQFGGTSGGSDPRGLTISTFTSNGGGDCGVDFNAAINNTGYGSFTFSAGTNERVRIDSSGNLLVGTDNNYSVGVSNYIFSKSGFVWANDNTGNANNRNWNAGVNGYANGAWQLTVSSANNSWPNAAYAFAVTSGGACYNTTGTYGTMSDVNFKENIADARGYVDDLMKVRVVKYSLKQEESSVATKLGVIAQEVEQIFPGLIDVGLTPQGEEFKSVKITVFVPMLIKAIQEQQAQIESLTQRLAAANI